MTMKKDMGRIMETTKRPSKALPRLETTAEQEMALAAQKCIMEALDRSRAPSIRLVANGNEGATLELPPAALRVIGQVLGLMSQGKPFTLVPNDHELSTVEAARVLNVSRPFLIKEIDAGRLPCHKVGTHRRITVSDLETYRQKLRAEREAALDAMASNADDLGLDY